MLWHVFVPESGDLPRALALRGPLLSHPTMHELDNLDEERAGARGRVEDLYERLLREAERDTGSRRWNRAPLELG